MDPAGLDVGQAFSELGIDDAALLGRVLVVRVEYEAILRFRPATVCQKRLNGCSQYRSRTAHTGRCAASQLGK